MFLTPELATLIVETKLTNSPRIDRKPYMVRLMFPPDALTIL